MEDPHLCVQSYQGQRLPSIFWTCLSIDDETSTPYNRNCTEQRDPYNICSLLSSTAKMYEASDETSHHIRGLARFAIVAETAVAYETQACDTGKNNSKCFRKNAEENRSYPVLVMSYIYR